MLTLRDWAEFLQTVANNWAGYATGGFIVATVWAWFVWKDKPVPRIVGIVLVFLFLFLAFKKSWQEQKDKVTALEDRSKAPVFDGVISALATGARVLA
jgi:hypothetical protein